MKEFPQEIPQVYFSSPIRKKKSRDNKSGIARGKLVDKYRNRLTFLREAGVLSSSRSTEINEDSSQESTSEGIVDDGMYLFYLLELNSERR